MGNRFAIHRITRYDSVATASASAPHRKKEAAETEMPTPVASATYAATHAGHFGITARTTPGNAHFAASRQQCRAFTTWPFPRRPRRSRTRWMQTLLTP